MTITNLPSRVGIKNHFRNAKLIKEDPEGIVYHAVQQFSHYLIIDKTTPENPELEYTVIKFDSDDEFRRYMNSDLGFDLTLED